MKLFGEASVAISTGTKFDIILNVEKVKRHLLKCCTVVLAAGAIAFALPLFELEPAFCMAFGVALGSFGAAGIISALNLILLRKRGVIGYRIASGGVYELSHDGQEHIVGRGNMIRFNRRLTTIFSLVAPRFNMEVPHYSLLDQLFPFLHKTRSFRGVKTYKIFELHLFDDQDNLKSFLRKGE